MGNDPNGNGWDQYRVYVLNFISDYKTNRLRDLEFQDKVTSALGKLNEAKAKQAGAAGVIAALFGLLSGAVSSVLYHFIKH